MSNFNRGILSHEFVTCSLNEQKKLMINGQRFILLLLTLLDVKTVAFIAANDMLYSWCETLFTNDIRVINGTRVTDLCVLNKPEPETFHEVKLIVVFTIPACLGIFVLVTFFTWISVKIRQKRQYRRQHNLLELVDYTALEISDIWE